MKVKKLLIAMGLITILAPINAKAAPGDFYYEDNSKMIKVAKADAKSNKPILKANKNKLYLQINSTTIVKYSDFFIRFTSEWANKELIQAYSSAMNDVNVQAPEKVKNKIKEIESNDESNNDSDIFAILDVY